MRKFVIAAAALIAVAVPAAAQAASRISYCTYQGIYVSEHTSCAFANNVLNDVYSGNGGGPTWVYSPVTHRNYLIRFRWVLSGYRNFGMADYVVTATGPNGIWMRFDMK